MKILHVAPLYWPSMGGSGTYVKEISERFARDGDEVAVYTTNALDFEYLFYPDRKRLKPGRERRNGVTVERFPVWHLPARNSLPRRLLSHLPFRWARPLFGFSSTLLPEMWRRLLTKRDVSLVHATPSPFYSLIHPALRCARRNGVPFVCTPFIHTGEPASRAQIGIHTLPFQTAILRECDHLLVQSGAERQCLLEAGAEEDRITILGAGVNPDGAAGGDGARFRKKYGIRGAIVFCVGIKTFDKGTFHTLRAMAHLWAKGREATLVLAGTENRDFGEFYRKQAEGIRKRCLLLEHIGEEEKRDLLHAGDILVMPSRADSYGIVYLEAWLAGKPVIGAFAGGVPEVISDGRDGFLVPFGDDAMLAEYIELLLDNASLRRRMGAGGYRKAVESCTWEGRYEAVRKIFQNLIAGSGAHGK